LLFDKYRYIPIPIIFFLSCRELSLAKQVLYFFFTWLLCFFASHNNTRGCLGTRFYFISGLFIQSKGSFASLLLCFAQQQLKNISTCFFASLLLCFAQQQKKYLSLPLFPSYYWGPGPLNKYEGTEAKCFGQLRRPQQKKIFIFFRATLSE